MAALILPTLERMREFFILMVQLVVTVARLIGPGGAKSIVAENLLLRQQLLVVSRTRRRAPRLSAGDRLLFGLWSLFLSPRRIRRAAIIPKPSTIRIKRRRKKQETNESPG